LGHTESIHRARNLAEEGYEESAANFRNHDRYDVQIRELGEELRLRERFPGGSPRGSATWHIVVPETTRVLFSSASGEFKSQGDYEGLDARSASGRISVRTASGDIDLKDVVVEVEASTASGEIDVSELQLAEESNFSSASGDIEVAVGTTPAYNLTLTSASGTVLLDFNENPVMGTFEFSALQAGGRIESPFAFHSEETFIHAGQTYDQKIFTRGATFPRITLATASGQAELKR
jgi:DUF4097 and DUF4098 domain-containing protein YvlB